MRLKVRRASDDRMTLALKIDDATFAKPAGPLRVIVVLGAGAQGDAGRCAASSLPAVICRSQANGANVTCCDESRKARTLF